MEIGKIREILGDQAGLLEHQCKTIAASQLTLPSPTYIDKVFSQTDRTTRVLGSYQRMMSHGRLADTGFTSILPVDQGIEHSAGASFAPNPMMFDPENIVKLAIEGGCNAVASTLGGLGSVARKYAHRIPFILKVNHSELFSYPNTYDQVPFGNVQQCFDMGAAGIGATVYWGSPESRRQLLEVSHAFAEAHRLGMFTVLWCYVRNNAFKTPTADQNVSADLRGPSQPPRRDHPSRHHQAEAARRKRRLQRPRAQGFRQDVSKKVYSDLTTDNLIDLDPLASRELLYGPDRAHQLGRRIRRQRHARCGHRPPSSTSAPVACA